MGAIVAYDFRLGVSELSRVHVYNCPSYKFLSVGRWLHVNNFGGVASCGCFFDRIRKQLSYLLSSTIE